MDLPEADSPVIQIVAPFVARCARSMREVLQTTLVDAGVGPVIMPAATVAPERSSTRRKLPVTRLRRYGSNSSGLCVRIWIRPISLSANVSVGVTR